MDLLLKMDSEGFMATPTVTESNVDDSDEGTVFLQDGQFVVPVTGHAVLLEDSQGVLEQYLVNDGEFYLHQEEEIEIDNKTDNPIVFYTKEEEYCDEEPYTFIFPDDNVIEGDQVIIDSEIQPMCEYAILKDGKLHLQTVEMEELPVDDDVTLEQSIKIDDDTCTIDLNKITGRNLVTGQTVTLDHYFEKLQKQLVAVESVEDGGYAVEGGLINKKLTIGKTASGKKIVGKILHFKTSENADNKTSSLSVTNDKSKSHKPTLRKRCILTKENCDVNIGKTLVGLMDLETVRNKLRNKNLAIKIVDKVYSAQTKDFAKTISYVYGHMELTDNDNWSFEVHDAETSAATMVFITILTTVDSHGKKSMRVNLIPSMAQTRCHTCGKEFKSTQQIRRHIINAHLSEETQACDRCGKSFSSGALLERHKRMLVCQKLHECPKCPKSFNSAGSLKRHVTVHDPSLRPLECTVCTQRFMDESSLRKHLLIHTGIRAYTCNVCARSFRNRGDLNFHRRIHDPVKQFCCEVCGRAFSRYSNMLRHTEIHRGTGALHRCDICGCSYSFVSSLTRHIVQKHLNSEQT